MRSWAWHRFLQKSCFECQRNMMGGGCLRSVPEGKREDIPGMEAESNSLSPLTALCCCLNLKMNRCWVAPGSFGANLGKYQGAHKQRDMLAHDVYAYTQYSSEYSLFLRYVFPGQFYMCDAVSFASISFALSFKLVRCLIALFQF